MRIPDGVCTVREDKEGGPVLPEVIEQPTGWSAGAGPVVLLIHGYNNSQKEAEDSYTAFLDKVTTGRGNGKIGTFFWPGDADLGLFDFLDFVSYPTEIPDALESAHALAAYLRRLAVEGGNPDVILFGHSLGCRLILETLNVFAAAAGPAPNITHVVLMAAAVPVDLAEQDKYLWRAGQLAKWRIVLFSTGDLVLQFGFPAGQGLAYVMGYEQEAYFEAVGRHGHPPSFHAEPIDCSENRHRNYWEDSRARRVLEEILQVSVDHATASRETSARETAARTLLPERTIPAWSVG